MYHGSGLIIPLLRILVYGPYVPYVIGIYAVISHWEKYHYVILKALDTVLKISLNTNGNTALFFPEMSTGILAEHSAEGRMGVY